MKAALLATFLLVALACVLHVAGGAREFFAACAMIGALVVPVGALALAVFIVWFSVAQARRRRALRSRWLLSLASAAILSAASSVALAVGAKEDAPRSYPARVVNVHDGDTLTADLDLGFDLTFRAVVRLHGLDAPELNTDDGVRSRDVLRAFLRPSTFTPLPGVRLSVVGREKYGRVLGTVYVGSTNVNAWLLQKGYARPYEGGKR